MQQQSRSSVCKPEDCQKVLFDLGAADKGQAKGTLGLSLQGHLSEAGSR